MRVLHDPYGQASERSVARQTRPRVKVIRTLPRKAIDAPRECFLVELDSEARFTGYRHHAVRGYNGAAGDHIIRRPAKQ